MRTLLRISLFWRFQIVGWAVAIAAFFPLKLDLTNNLHQALALAFVRDGSSFFLTLALRRIYRKFWSNNGVHMATLLIAACAIAGAAQNVLFYLLRHILPLTAEIFRTHFMTFNILYERTGLLFAWSFLYFGIKIWLEERAKERRLNEEREMREQIELQMLRSLTNSHFLCNALSTIQRTLDNGRQGAGEMVQAMSDYLNYSLKHRSDNVVPLGEEVNALEDYLVLQHAALGPILDFGLQVAKGLDTVEVPGFVLQPLVENAIKYGRETHQRRVSIRVVIQREGDRLVLEVYNTGHWILPDPRRQSGGVGLETIKRKLQWLYSDQHSFTTLEEEGWVSVRIQFPL
jgi:LytS/YehU family sensor histidine kinase